MIEKILNRFYWLAEILCKIMMCVQIVCVAFVVVGRFVFSKTPAWGEETTLLCLVWVALISAAITLRENGHMRITAFDNRMSKRTIFVLDLICDAFLLLFAAMMIKEGLNLAKITSMSILPGLRIKSSYLYSATWASGIVYVAAVLENLWRLLTGKELPKSPFEASAGD